MSSAAVRRRFARQRVGFVSSGCSDSARDGEVAAIRGHRVATGARERQPLLTPVDDRGVDAERVRGTVAAVRALSQEICDARGGPGDPV